MRWGEGEGEGEGEGGRAGGGGGGGQTAVHTECTSITDGLAK
jgi:hypothetical protein